MKKLFGDSFQHTFNNTLSSLSQGAAEIKHSWQTNNPAPETQISAPSSSQAHTNSSETHLRLPLASARKLRWYDKGDLAMVVKANLQEKRDLMEAIAALKKLLIRAGYTEATIDSESRQILLHLETLRVTDEGVCAVLLAGLQGQMDEWAEELSKLTAERDQLKKALAASELRMSFSLTADGDDDMHGSTAPAPRPAIDPQLLDGISAALEKFESANADAAAKARAVRNAEQAIVLRESEASVRMMLASATASTASAAAGFPAAEDSATAAHNDVSRAAETREARVSDSGDRSALLSKLQRLELERRVQVEELAEVHEQLREVSARAADADRLRSSLTTSEERCRALEVERDALTHDLATVRSALKSAEEGTEKLKSDLRRLQGMAARAEAVQRYQDHAVEVEERADAAERRAQVAEARCGKLEALLKEAQAELRASHKAASAASAEYEALLARTQAAETAAEAARQSGGEAEKERGSEAAARWAEQARALEDEVRTLTRELSTVRATVTALESRCEAAEGREARMSAELGEMDTVLAEKEEMAAQVSALRERLAELRLERGALESCRELLREAEDSKSRLEEELVATGQLVVTLEARLRDGHARSANSELAAQLAEGRARAAEAAVSSEVERRLAVAASSRALWPHPIMEEFSRLEARLEAAMAATAAVRSDLAAANAASEADGRARSTLERRVMELEERLAKTERESAAQIRDLESLLDHVTREADELREALSRNSGEFDSRGGAASIHTPLRRINSNISDGSASAGGKWQVANRVGGGSLYGLLDNFQPPPQTPRTSMHNTNNTYNPTLPVHATNSISSNGVVQLPPSSSQNNLNHSDTPSLSGRDSAEINVGSLTAMQPPPNKASKPGPDRVPEVDIVYLKNVVLKFLEATAAGRSSEREALLPAIATLLHATPAEFVALRRVLTNTAPASVQMLSALGIRY